MARYFLCLVLPVLIVISGCWQVDIGRSYYSNGSLRTEATVHNGMLDGPSTMYYENGDKMSEAIYKAGLLDGLATAYYEDGKIKATAGYRQGLLHGESATWSKDGLSVKKVNFDSGRIVE